MNRKSISAFVVAAIILLPIIFLPFSGDQSIFALGGKMLFEGKSLYHDYVDLKPPMVFIFYGFISLFAGTNEVGFRIFEFIWQLATIFILFKVVKRYFSLNAALAAIIIFSAVYTSMNFSQTLQPESFMNMIAVLLIWLQLRGKNNIISAVVKGVLIGFATSFKFTFGMFLIIILIDDLFNSDSKLLFIRNSVITILAMAIAFILSFIPLLSSHSYEGFKNVVQYLNFYSAYPPVNLALFKEALIKLSVFWGDNFSIALLFLVGAGLFKYFAENENQTMQRKIVLIANFILLLLFSIIVEKKFHEYHFQRMLIPLSIAAGLGFELLFEKIKSVKKCNVYCKIMACGFLILLVLLSPVPRLLNIARVPIIALTDTEKYNQIYELEGSTQILRTQYIAISRYIHTNFAKGSKIILIATGSNQINLMLYPDYQISKFSQSIFYLGNGAPDDWKMDIKLEINNADAIIIQNNDANPLITGHEFTSFQSIEQDTQLYEIIKNKFVKNELTKDFFIFKRK